MPFWLQVLSVALAPFLGFAGIGIGFLSERNSRAAYVKDERRKVYQEYLQLASDVSMFYTTQYPMMLQAGSQEHHNAASAKIDAFAQRAYRTYMLLRLVGSPDAVRIASRIFHSLKMAIDLVMDSVMAGKVDKDRWEFLSSMGVDIQASFIEVARKDLGLPKGERSLPFNPLPDEAYRFSQAAEQSPSGQEGSESLTAERLPGSAD